MNIIYPEDILHIFIQKGKHVLPLRSNDYLVDKFNFYSRNIGYILSEYYVWNLARGIAESSFVDSITSNDP